VVALRLRATGCRSDRVADADHVVREGSMEGIYRTARGEREIRSWCAARLASWDRPHRTTTIETELGATHVVTAGVGPPLILIPGTNFAAATWLELIDRLASQRLVHAIDLPGQPGLSDPARRKHVTDDYGRWLVTVAGALDAPQPTVVGHSLGALVAMLALAAGAEADRLVLLDPAGLRRLSVTPGVLAATIPWLRRSDRRSAAGLLRMMMAPGREPERDLVEWMALVGEHVRSSFAPPSLDVGALSRLRGLPIDVRSGEHDVFLPPAKLRRAVERRLAVDSFAVVGAAGHLLPHEQPTAIVELLRPPTDAA
jgi:pimeloyl-ACP methyl ester carboxylesterase